MILSSADEGDCRVGELEVAELIEGGMRQIAQSGKDLKQLGQEVAACNVARFVRLSQRKKKRGTNLIVDSIAISRRTRNDGRTEMTANVKLSFRATLAFPPNSFPLSFSPHLRSELRSIPTPLSHRVIEQRTREEEL